MSDATGGGAPSDQMATKSRVRLWSVFDSGAFRELWGASALSLLGDAFSYIAVAWLVLQLTGSSLALGSVLVAQALPRAVLMVVGGALADLRSPRLTMLGSMGLRVALVAPLAVLVITGQVRLWEVYGIAVVFGVVDAFFMPARTAIVPSVVRNDQLEPANAALNITMQLSLIVGPALAGLVVASVGTGWAFAADAACFAAGMPLIFLLPATRPQAAPSGGQAGIGGQIAEGMRYAWRDVGIRASLIIIAAVDFSANGALGVGLPTLAHGRFGAGAAGLGVLLGAWGVGATAGAAGAGALRPPKRFGLMVVAVTAWIGLGIVAVGLIPSLVPAAVAMALAGIATGVINTYGVSWLQRRTEASMLGRVMSLVMLASMGLTPVAYALSGLVAQLNPTILFLVCGGMILAASTGALASRSVRSL